MSLEVGQKAPEFESKDQNGNPIKLSDFKGKKVVLYFYPKDNTPGCTAQACNLRDNHEALKAAGYEVLGISSDSVKSHKKFVEKQELPFTLIADEDKSVHEKYGTWVEKQMYGKTYMGTARTTFIIDEEGVITEIIEKVKTKDHTNQIIK
ncbi:thioredoxin-dependent thiol peroxidase [Pleomorphovibrio marinus]|uniref:thioredoxin-dependent thiol peroxidase n=1 Tax=Pleomorphovibrio marinus TaxID=2164132 RepID=UPI000E0C3C76|nr:thioredoxin-dependent thiol peroxidase [Pleomorphovibrio marinus]